MSCPHGHPRCPCCRDDVVHDVPADGHEVPCDTCQSPTFLRARADAWDAGFDAGHQSARAVNPEWPAQPANPYREDRTDG